MERKARRRWTWARHSHVLPMPPCTWMEVSHTDRAALAHQALACAAAAKAYATRAARTVCETAIQVHGGIGNTWECFVHVYLRRALLSSALLGDEGHHLRSLAYQRVGAERGAA